MPMVCGAFYILLVGGKPMTPYVLVAIFCIIVVALTSVLIAFAID